MQGSMVKWVEYSSPDHNIQALYKGWAWGGIKRISFSIVREMVPVYVKPFDTNPVPYSRGKRGIAGSIDFEWALLPKFWNRVEKENLPFPELIPSFDIVITKENDTFRRELSGAELLSEGYGIRFADFDIRDQYIFAAVNISSTEE